MSSNASSQSSAFKGIEINFRHLYYVLHERVRLIIGCALAGLLCAGGYLLRTPKSYEGVAIVRVQAQQNLVNDIKEENSNLEWNSPDALKTIEASFVQRELLRRLLKTEKLTSADLGLRAGTYSDDDLIDALTRSLSASLVRGTRLIEIDAWQTNPAMAARLANGLVREYQQSLLDQRSLYSDQATQFLVDQAARLQQKLVDSEQALQAYREQANSASLEESQDIVIAELKDLNAKLTQGKTERLQLEAARNQLHDAPHMTLEQLLAVPYIANSPGVVDLNKQLAAAQADLASLEQRYLELHPKLIQAKGQVAEIRTNLRAAALAAAGSLDQLYKAACDTEAKYEQAVQEQQKKALALGRMSIRYKTLQRDVDSNSALFESVLKSLKEGNVAKEVPPDSIQVVQPAFAPRYPSKPRVKLILAAALAGGSLLGVALAVLLQAMDGSFQTVDQVEAQLHCPVLTALPRFNNIGGFQKLGAAPPPNSLLTAALRVLRTTLALRPVPVKSLLITSSFAGEGKSFCAANYAITVAALGQRTLLIDADLHRPAIERAFFERPFTRPGLTDVLGGSIGLAAAVRPTEVENLFVLTAGTNHTDPASLLHGPAFAKLLTEASQSYAKLIFDSAPVHAVSDSLLIARHLDAVCMLVEAGKTPRSVAARALQLLSGAGATLAGVIFTKVPERGRYYYHYFAENYGYDDPANV